MRSRRGSTFRRVTGVLLLFFWATMILVWGPRINWRGSRSPPILLPPWYRLPSSALSASFQFSFDDLLYCPSSSSPPPPPPPSRWFLPHPIPKDARLDGRTMLLSQLDSVSPSPEWLQPDWDAPNSTTRTIVERVHQGKLSPTAVTSLSQGQDWLEVYGHEKSFHFEKYPLPHMVEPSRSRACLNVSVQGDYDPEATAPVFGKEVRYGWLFCDPKYFVAREPNSDPFRALSFNPRPNRLGTQITFNTQGKPNLGPAPDPSGSLTKEGPLFNEEAFEKYAHDFGQMAPCSKEMLILRANNSILDTGNPWVPGSVVHCSPNTNPLECQWFKDDGFRFGIDLHREIIAFDRRPKIAHIFAQYPNAWGHCPMEGLPRMITMLIYLPKDVPLLITLDPKKCLGRMVEFLRIAGVLKRPVNQTTQTLPSLLGPVEETLAPHEESEGNSLATRTLINWRGNGHHFFAQEVYFTATEPYCYNATFKLFPRESLSRARALMVSASARIEQTLGELQNFTPRRKPWNCYPGRCIVIVYRHPRLETRGMWNWEEVIAALQQRARCNGDQVYIWDDFKDPDFRFSDTVVRFYEADVVVGIVGAALGHLMFMAPNSHLLEMLFDTSDVHRPQKERRHQWMPPTNQFGAVATSHQIHHSLMYARGTFGSSVHVNISELLEITSPENMPPLTPEARNSYLLDKNRNPLYDPKELLQFYHEAASPKS